jgi:hypothetical protein
MLSAYFDESGEHDPQTGKLTRLTVAGALSTLDNWQRISAEWERALKENGINAFHMAPFEAYRGEFKDWSKLKHQALLRCLLDIITSVPLIVVGASLPVEAFKATYPKCVAEVIKNSYISARLNFQDDVMSLVFAITPEFSALRIKKYCDDIRVAIPKLQACSSGDAAQLYPLQVADFLAYEISHAGRNAKERYPLRQLRRGPVTFHVRTDLPL